MGWPGFHSPAGSDWLELAPFRQCRCSQRRRWTETTPGRQSMVSWARTLPGRRRRSTDFVGSTSALGRTKRPPPTAGLIALLLLAVELLLQLLLHERLAKLLRRGGDVFGLLAELGEEHGHLRALLRGQLARQRLNHLLVDLGYQHASAEHRFHRLIHPGE